jgi:hypothetical protein
MTIAFCANDETISELILAACFLSVYASHPPITRRMTRLDTGVWSKYSNALRDHGLL